MQKKAVLHKQCVMHIIIGYIKMENFLDVAHSRAHIGDVDQNAHLTRILVHGLDLLLNFKTVIFCKVHDRDNDITWKAL